MAIQYTGDPKHFAIYVVDNGVMEFTYRITLTVYKQSDRFCLLISTDCSSSSSTRIPLGGRPSSFDLISSTREHCQEFAAHLFQRNLIWMNTGYGDCYVTSFDLPVIKI